MTRAPRAAPRVAVWRCFARPRTPARRSLFWPVKGWIFPAALLALLVVAAASVWLFDAFVIRQALRGPEWAHTFFGWVTLLGNSGWYLWSTGLVFLILATLPRARLSPVAQGVVAALMARFSFLFFAVGVPALFVTLLKRLLGRARPYVWGDPDPFSFVPFTWGTDYASLPSGHATNAFAAAIAIGGLWPRARLPMWILAAAIALSRIVLIKHYPSDVIVGAIVGTLGALLVRSWYASRRLAFTIGGDGAIHRLPGPSWRRTKAVARKLLAP